MDLGDDVHHTGHEVTTMDRVCGIQEDHMQVGHTTTILTHPQSALQTQKFHRTGDRLDIVVAVGMEEADLDLAELADAARDGGRVDAEFGERGSQCLVDALARVESEDEVAPAAVLAHGVGISVEVKKGPLKTGEGCFVSIPGTEGLHSSIDGRRAHRSAAVTLRAAVGMGDRGRIILVEDEAMQRRLGRRILVGAGWEGIEAETAEEGIELFSEMEGEFTLVASDLTLPRMDGRAFAAAVREYPDVPILFMTGHTKRIWRLVVLCRQGRPTSRSRSGSRRGARRSVHCWPRRELWRAAGCGVRLALGCSLASAGTGVRLALGCSLASAGTGVGLPGLSSMVC